jgi:ankyrin repeat protein
MQLLLAAGADVDASNRRGWAPLYAAAVAGQHEVVQLLLAAGANVNAAAKSGVTPVHAAAAAGHTQVVQLLLAAGADAYAAAKSGMTPLYAAAKAGHTTVVQLLLEARADVKGPDKFGRALLFKAAREGHPEVLRLLLSAGFSVNIANSHGQTLLYAAAAAGQHEMVQLLLAAGAKVDAVAKSGYTPLRIGACPTGPYYYQLPAGHLKVVRLLLAAGADVDAVCSNGETPLLAAAWRGDVALIQLLLSKGANPRVRDDCGKTAFVRAAESWHEPPWSNHRGAVQLLLEAWGQTVLPADDLAAAINVAAQRRKMPIVVWLAMELHKLCPDLAVWQFQGESSAVIAESMATALTERASDVSSFPEQRAALRKREEDVATAKTGMQQLVVSIAGMSKHRRQVLC